MDPLPQLRDTVARLNNKEIHRYTRVVKCVVTRLLESLLETNEIKSLTRGKKAIEKAIEHTRTDIRINKESQENRFSRPAPEKGPVSSADLTTHEKLKHLMVRVFQRHSGIQLPKVQ